MLQRFLNEVWIYSDKFIKFEITYRQSEAIKSRVLKELNLVDYFQLKDRLDGVNFYENAISRLAPFYYLETMYDVKWPISLLKKNIEDLDFCIINGECYYIITLKFGELNTGNLVENRSYLVFIRKGERQFYFCGKLSKNYNSKTNDINFKILEMIF